MWDDEAFYNNPIHSRHWQTVSSSFPTFHKYETYRRSILYLSLPVIYPMYYKETNKLHLPFHSHRLTITTYETETIMSYFNCRA